MAKPFKNLVDRMTPLSRERVRRRTAELSRQMALQELRQAMELTQQEIAAKLQMNQAAVSKLEHQSDMYVSTLRRFLSAVGGELRIVASFAEGDVVISQFEELRTGDSTRAYTQQSAPIAAVGEPKPEYTTRSNGAKRKPATSQARLRGRR